MKIAIIRQYYNPFGGAERLIERALSSLASQGNDVTLICRNWKGELQEGFHKIICNPTASLFSQGRTARNRNFAAEAIKIVAQNHFDIVQSHERVPGCTIFRAGDGVHAAWLDHRSRTLNRWQRFGMRISPFHRYELRAERAMFNHGALKAIICNSNMVADEIRDHYGIDQEKIHIIYNGVDVNSFHPSLADRYRNEVRSGLNLSPSTPLLLFVGSGFERKGLPQLLRALVHARRKDIFLTVVGHDKRMNKMKKLASDLGIAKRVHFTGPLNDVKPWYGAADGFVLPTLYDPGPNAALEAMACGLPMLTSDTCGAKEWVKQDQNGWVVDAMDSIALSRGLDSLADVAGDCSFRMSAREAVSGFTLEAMTERFLQLYTKLGEDLPQNPNRL